MNSCLTEDGEPEKANGFGRPAACQALLASSPRVHLCELPHCLDPTSTLSMLPWTRAGHGHSHQGTAVGALRTTLPGLTSRPSSQSPGPWPLKKPPPSSPRPDAPDLQCGNTPSAKAPRPHPLQPSRSPLKSSPEKFLGEFSVKILALFELPGCQVKKGHVMSY